MKRYIYLMCLSMSLVAQVVWAQGPRLDPTFRPAAVYQPAAVDQALLQPDGKLLLVTTASRVGGRPANGQLSRLLANSDQVDTVFAANVAGLQGMVLQAAVRPDNHIVLITGRGSLSLGGVTRLGILGLSPDGTVDAAFNAITTVPNFLTSVVAQPDGKVLVGGGFGLWAAGQPAAGLVRLTTMGSLDTGFQTALGQGFDNPSVDFVSLQVNGTIIVGGRFLLVNGVVQSRLARLLPSGAFDASFRPVLPSAANASVLLYPVGAVTQPDGKVVVASWMSAPDPAWQPLERLLPTGARDPDFQPGTNFSQYFPVGQRSSPLCLLANGKLLVGTAAESFDGTPIGQVVRLTPAGRLDPTFASTLVAQPGLRGPVVLTTLSLTPLPGGDVLAAGGAVHYGFGGVPTPLARLDSATGGQRLSFAPRVHVPGEVRDVVRQPDGRYLVAGLFTEINGSTSPYLARLGADGTVEPGFTANAQPDDQVNSLALQVDGKVLVGGAFQTLGSSLLPGVGRLLPTGAPDPAFAPTFAPGTTPYPYVGRVVLEPSGNALLLGNFVLNATTQLVRLGGQTGQFDPSFAPIYSNAVTFLVQPDGAILLGGPSIRVVGQGAESLVRLQANGLLDPTFTPVPTSFSASIFALARDPATGQIYATGTMNSAPAVLRFSATGTRDLSYQPLIPGSPTASSGSSLALQPNGRLLLGGLFYFSASATTPVGLVRFLPSGAVDPSFNPDNGPGSAVSKLLVQADGAIIAAGTFKTVGGMPVLGLARLLDANVLAVGRAQAAASLVAWPVPAHDVLHLALDAAARATRVVLLDAMGREVRSWMASTSEISLSVAGLPAGTYLLRVDYPSGPVMRRVAVAK